MRRAGWLVAVCGLLLVTLATCRGGVKNEVRGEASSKTEVAADHGADRAGADGGYEEQAPARTSSATRLDPTGPAPAHKGPHWASAPDSLGFEPTLEYVMGRFNPAEHPAFKRVAERYANRAGLYLHRATYEAFRRMHDAAATDGVNLTILSATRNFDYQRGIWEAKWEGSRKIEGGKDASVAYPDPADRARAILRYSSMPGTSRHHWGSDLDLNAFNNDYFKTGEGLEVYNWLSANAARFGFCQPYTEKGEGRPHGYEEERWHWSYLPLSRPLTDFAARHLRDDLIRGFGGAAAADKIRVVERYVLGINEHCR